MKARSGRFGGFDVGDRREAGLGRQTAERLVEQLAERGRIDVADHGNPQRVLGQHAADIVLQIGDINFRHAFKRAVRRPAIGVVAKGDFEEFAAGQRRRIGGLAPQAREDLRANSLDIGALEARRCQRHPQQVEGFVPVIPEHAQRAAEIIPRRREAQLDGAAVEALVEGLGIKVAGAFIEQIRNHVADAGLAGRILRRAAAEGVFHRNQRHGGVLHEPGFDTSG